VEVADGDTSKLRWPVQGMALKDATLDDCFLPKWMHCTVF
jgi:hypothetical protein